MRKVLDSECERLSSRRFFYKKSWAVIVLSIFLFFAISGNVYADGDGSLTLDPSVITNEGTQVGGSGDFSIRGQLFSDDLNQASKNNQEAQEKVTSQAEKIDFQNTNTVGQEKLSVPKDLFQNYQPQVIPSKASDTINNSQPIVLLYVFVGIVLLIVGSLIGRTWARRRK